MCEVYMRGKLLKFEKLRCVLMLEVFFFFLCFQQITLDLFGVLKFEALFQTNCVRPVGRKFTTGKFDNNVTSGGKHR